MIILKNSFSLQSSHHDKSKKSPRWNVPVSRTFDWKRAVFSFRHFCLRRLHSRVLRGASIPVGPSLESTDEILGVPPRKILWDLETPLVLSRFDFFFILSIHTVIWNGKCRRNMLFPAKNLYHYDRHSSLRHLERIFLSIFWGEFFLRHSARHSEILQGFAGRKRLRTAALYYSESSLPSRVTETILYTSPWIEQKLRRK